VDLGGGTSDVAVLEVEDEGRGHTLKFSVLASGALTRAGDQVDTAVASQIGGALPKDRVERDALELVAQQLKEDVTASGEAVRQWALQPQRTFSLNGDQLDKAVKGLVDDIVRFTDGVTRGARLREEILKSPTAIRAEPWAEVGKSIDAVVIAGGTGRLSLVQQKLREKFKCEVVLVDRPQHSVVEGLASRTDYGRINMPRPPYSFRLRYKTSQGEDEVILYEAFTPFCSPSNAVAGDTMNFEDNVLLPGALKGPLEDCYLFCTSLGGTEPIVDFKKYKYKKLKVDPKKKGQGNGAKSSFTETWVRKEDGKSSFIKIKGDGREPVAIVIRPNGTLFINRTEISVREWPVVRGKNDPEHGPTIEVVIGPPAGHDWRHH
jgi:hypothetical protein